MGADWGELAQMKMWFWKLRRTLLSFYSCCSSMECSAVYVTPKRKFNRDTFCSPSDASPVEKRAKESNSPDMTSPGEDQVMATLNLSEGVAEKYIPWVFRYSKKKINFMGAKKILSTKTNKKSRIFLTSGLLSSPDLDQSRNFQQRFVTLYLVPVFQFDFCQSQLPL